jgi:hypothetical protein
MQETHIFKQRTTETESGLGEKEQNVWRLGEILSKKFSKATIGELFDIAL